jgi:hypothetical protein
MSVPLFWSALPTAAEWLSTYTGKLISPLQLIDFVAHRSHPDIPTPTVIKAVLPRDVSLAVVRMCGAPREMDDLREHPAHKSISARHSDPRSEYRDIAYLASTYGHAAPLCRSQLQELLLRGSTVVSMVCHGPGQWQGQDLSEIDSVWLLPLGVSHHATIETCGINQDDLKELAELLIQTMPEAPALKEGRQAQRYEECKKDGLVMPDNTYAALPRGIGKVAKRLGISRQALSEDVKAHIGRIYGR